MENLRLCSAASGRSAVVLDWGCGTGMALSQLAEEKGLRVVLIGFAKESHKEWAVHKNANFLQGLPEELPNHFKSSSIDLIFSHNGLNYLSGDEIVHHLLEMHSKLKRNGKMFSITQMRQLHHAWFHLLGNILGIFLSLNKSKTVPQSFCQKKRLYLKKLLRQFTKTLAIEYYKIFLLPMFCNAYVSRLATGR